MSLDWAAAYGIDISEGPLKSKYGRLSTNSLIRLQVGRAGKALRDDCDLAQETNFIDD